MPASHIHETLATDALRTADLPLYGQHMPALLAGAQGPDTFFYYRFFQPAYNHPVSALGLRLHEERTADFLLALLDCAAGDEPSRAYALGFLSHYAADTMIHPFVYARSYDREGVYRSNLHCGLEAAMDTWLYRQRGGKGVPRQMTGIAALTPESTEAIARTLAAALNRVFPEAAIAEPVIRGSFVWAARISRLLHSPFGVKYTLFGWLARLAGHPGLLEAHATPRRLPAWDFSNTARLGWSSPWAEEHCSRQSLTELLEVATQRSTKLLRGADALWREDSSMDTMRDILGDLHYDSALPWQHTIPIYDGQRRQEPTRWEGAPHAEN